MSKIEIREYRNHKEFLMDWYKIASLFIYSYLKITSSKDKNELQEVALRSISQKIQIIENNLSNISTFIAADNLRRKYRLGALEWIGVIICVLNEVSQNFRKLLSKTTDSLEKLTYENLIKIFNLESDTSKIENFEGQLNQLKNKLSPLGFAEDSLEISDKLFKIITQNLKHDLNTKGVEIYSTEDLSEISMIVREEEAKKIKNTVSKASKIADDDTVYYFMYGQAGIGKKTLVKRVSKSLEKNLIVIDLNTLISNYKDNWYDRFSDIIYEQNNPETTMCLENFNIFFEEKNNDFFSAFSVLEAVEKCFKLVFVLSNKKINDLEFEEKFYWFKKHIPDLTSSENYKIWKEYISYISDVTDETPEEIAGKFTFTPKQIKGTIRAAKKAYLENNEKKLNKQQFYQCAYSQIISTLDKTARLITKKYTWDDIVLDEDIKIQLRKACNRIKYKYEVYNEWGMGEKVLYGTGLSMIFYGKPGTGKTMAAQVMASELGLDLYQVDTARVISKYIGETEKNLKEIFDEAKKSNVILLFDEADALFSKRTEIKDSHDKNANLETAFLLQKMEEYDGITILTTNIEKNIDPAFDRRVTFKIHFAMIDPGTPGSHKYEEHMQIRRDLWNIFLKNGKMPLAEDIDFEYLAKQFEVSGADVRKIAVTAGFLAKEENLEKINFSIILKSVRDVLDKDNREFGIHAHLLN